jgi:hypothetical protein
VDNQWHDGDNIEFTSLLCNCAQEKGVWKANMFGWKRRSAYRQDILCTVGSLLGDDTDGFRRMLLRAYPRIEVAVKSGIRNDQSKYEAAICIAHFVIADTIAKMQDPDRARAIARNLRVWIDRGGVTAFASDQAGHRFEGIDGLELRLRSALALIASMRNNNLIDDYMVGRFSREIFDTLEGFDASERQRRRYVDVFECIKPTLTVGTDDNSALMPADCEIIDKPKFSGTSVEVNIVPRSFGIVLERQDTGEPITERRKLTQDILKTIPQDAEKFKFANFVSRSGQMYSCVIAEPGSQVFGDMRAFWWALAKAIVTVTQTKANAVRMTEAAFAHVSGHAQGMLQCAFDQTPIHQMRDQFMPTRNIHFEVINEAISTAGDESEVLGLNIALAMVMAIQSEDPILERYAYDSFRKFLWLPGEEPEEFWSFEGECQASSGV